MVISRPAEVTSESIEDFRHSPLRELLNLQNKSDFKREADRYIISVICIVIIACSKSFEERNFDA